MVEEKGGLTSEGHSRLKHGRQLRRAASGVQEWKGTEEGRGVVGVGWEKQKGWRKKRKAERDPRQRCHLMKMSQPPAALMNSGRRSVETMAHRRKPTELCGRW